MCKKKVAIIGIKGLPPAYGGFETLANYLTFFEGKNFSITVFCGKTPLQERLKEYNGAKLIYLPFNANGTQSIIYDILSIIISWFRFDSLLILGTPGVLIIPILRVFKKTRTIINFGGIEWKRDKWNWAGRLFLKITESVAVKFAACMIADNQYFVDYIKATYRRPSTLIEYGGNHTKKRPVTVQILIKYPFVANEYYLSISRAQPDNNLHLLLETFSFLPKKNLVLISNWDVYKYGRCLKMKYVDFPNIFMVDAIYDLKILDVIRSNCCVYIHSHLYCGTAPSLVEAMNLGLPIIAFDNETNRFTTENRALYFKDESSLQNIILKLNQYRLNEMGKEMNEISERRYSWERISKLYAVLF